MWIDCGELWTLPRVPQPPKARGGAAIAWHAHLDATESTKLDLRINWCPCEYLGSVPRYVARGRRSLFLG